MVKPESNCPYTSSQQGWELPEQQRIAVEATSTTKTAKPPSPTLTSSPRELGFPTNGWHPSSSSKSMKRIITKLQFISFIQ
jgi:hypothetical protein